MGGRYLVTGVQLAVLQTSCGIDPDKAEKIFNEILENQYVGESDETISYDVTKLLLQYDRRLIHKIEKSLVEKRKWIDALANEITDDLIKMDGERE